MQKKLHISNENIERTILGSVLVNNKNLQEIESFTKEEDFYNTANRIIWRAILLVHSKNLVVDSLSVSNMLTERDELEKVGGLSYIADLSQYSSFNIRALATDLKKLRLKDEVLTLGKKLVETSEKSEPAELLEMLSKAQEELRKLDIESSITKKSYIEQFNANAKFEDFRAEIEKTGKNAFYRTGFDKLDNLLKGGLKGGLTMLGAMPSLGKTTFCLQVAQYIASQETDVLYISLEQSTTELMSKIVSCLTGLHSFATNNGIKYALSQNEIQEGNEHVNFYAEQRENYNLAMGQFKEISKHMFFFEAFEGFKVKNIDEIIRRHIEYTGNTPVVFVDYLQLIEPPRERLTDKQSVDINIKALKQITRTYKVPVVCISSFNRGSYNTQASMSSFKESGGIEYGADVVWLFQYKGIGLKKQTEAELQSELDVASRKSPREVELRIDKNRRAGKGELLGFDYYSVCNMFVEAKSN